MIKLALADLDGTTVQYDVPHQSTWNALGESLPCRDEWYALEKRCVHDPSLWQEWLEGNARLIKGYPVALTHQKLFPIPYTPGAYSFFRNLQCRKGILSSGVGFVAREVQRELKFDFCHANELDVVDGFFSGTGQVHVPLHLKHEKLQEIADQEEVRLEEIAYFGDSSFDITCFKMVGLAVAVNPKSEDVRQAAHHTIYHFKDARRLLHGRRK